MKRASFELKLPGFQIGSHIGPWNLDAKELYPVYKAIIQHCLKCNTYCSDSGFILSDCWRFRSLPFCTSLGYAHWGKIYKVLAPMADWWKFIDLLFSLCTPFNLTSYFYLSSFYLSISISIYKNGRSDVCLFACLSVGMWRANGNPNHHTDLDKILHAHPRLSKEGFGAGLTATPFSSPLGMVSLKH